MWGFILNQDPQTYLRIITLIWATMLVLFYFRYLKLRRNDFDEKLKKFEKKRREEWDSLYDKLFNSDNTEIASLIKQQIKEDHINDYIMEKITEFTKVNNYSEISKQEESLYSHLLNMIEVQNKKANMNLFLGIVTSAFGIFLIMYFFIDNNIEKEIAMSSFVANFLPKLSVILIVETLAFFFLKLYKNALNDVKYFSNQLSEFKIKFASFNVAILYEDVGFVKECVLTLIKTQVALSQENNNDFSFSIDKLEQIIKVLNKDK